MIVEPFNGGLVTARDPALLNPGELQRADNSFYRPNSQSLFKSPSRTSWATGLGAAVGGLAFCAFDFVKINSCALVTNAITVTTGNNFNTVSVGARVFGDGIPFNTTVASVVGSTTITLSNAAAATGTYTLQFDADDQVLVQANGSYRRAKATKTTGTFSTIETVTEGDQIEAIHYANNHVVLNGRSPNRVLKADGTMRPHGLKPISESCTATVNTSGGTWLLDTGVGYYAYWTTEYDSVNDIESDFIGKPTAVNVSTTTSRVTVVRPSRLNATATHWRLYRSVRMEASDIGATLSGSDQTTARAEWAAKESVGYNGYRIGQFPLANDGTSLSFEDGGGTQATTAIAYAGSVAYTTAGSWLGYGMGTSTVVWSGTTPLGAPNATDYTMTITKNETTTNLRGSAVLGTFSIPATTSPITGITVTATGKKSNNIGVRIRIGIARFANQFSVLEEKNIAWTTSETTVTLGGANDLWLTELQKKTHGLVPDDFSNTNFQIEIIGQTQLGAPAGSYTMDIDAIGVSVTHGKISQNAQIEQFERVVVRPFGLEVAVGRNGEPPLASFGDIFQDSLVTNDIDDESVVRYSWPAKIDAVPSVYYLNFETKDQDKVTRIRTVGNVLVVGTLTQLHRVNYLPRETDAEFDRGRAVEMFEANHGIAGPKATAIFSGPDGAQALAYMNRAGLFATDGYRTRPLTTDIDWEKIVEVDYLNICELQDNPDTFEILLDYVPKGSATPTKLTKRLRFNYHPSHLKEGMLKVSGPSTVNTLSSALGVLSDGSRPLYTGDATTGTVYLENQGNETTMVAQSREMFQGGVGGDWRVRGATLRHTLYNNTTASPFNISMTARSVFTGIDPLSSSAVTVAVPTFTADGSPAPIDRRLSRFMFNQMGEGISFTTSIGAGTEGFSLDFLAIDEQPTPRANSQKAN